MSGRQPPLPSGWLPAFYNGTGQRRVLVGTQIIFNLRRCGENTQIWLLLKKRAVKLGAREREFILSLSGRLCAAYFLRNYEIVNRGMDSAQFFMAKILITEEQIKNRVKELGKQISEDYRNKEIFMVVMLRGAFIFAADLIRELKPTAYVDFLKVSSYRGRESSGEVKISKGLKNIHNKNVLIVEDIVDTGLTLSRTIKLLSAEGPKSLEIVSLLDKPSRRTNEVEVKYTGFVIEDRFVIGYGLDENQKYRQIPHIIDFTN